MNKMIRTALALALFACASIVLLAPARAQSVYGSIFGTVTDKSGAAVPGATITVTDEAKGTVVNVTSNASGDYNVPHLIPDVYDIKVEAKGFKNFETKGIQVLADTAPRIDPTMDVGGATETVQVNADQQPELKTDRADVATIFDQQQISSLPIGDQNFTNLQLLLPGAQKLGWSHAADENPQASQQIQVDGQAFGGTAFELDGTDNQDPILGIIVINPAMDAVTETKISTQNYDAELGKAVSAVVTAQTKSGTNNFHGSAYDFRTGNANLAHDPFSQTPGNFNPVTNPGGMPAGLKNRFGGSIGGPILKDRAFFFGNYEGQRQKVGTSATDTVATPYLIATCLGQQTASDGTSGCDFKEYADAFNAGGQLIYDNSSGSPVPFSNNIIPASKLSPQSVALLTLLAPFKPNAGTPGQANYLGNNFFESGTGLFNSDQWTERADWTFNEKMHAFERFSRFTDILSGKVMYGDAGGPGFGLGNYGGNSKGANDSLASGMDIALNPKLLTDFRLAYYRYNVIDSKYDQGVAFADQLGIPGVNTGSAFTSGAPGFLIDTGSGTAHVGAGLGVNRCNCPLTEKEDQFQIVNNWTKILGNHSVKVGVDLRYARNLRVPSDTDRAGEFDIHASQTGNANGDFGSGFATFMLGDVSHFGRYVGNPASNETNAKEFQKRTFFYAQDTWRATHNLTLNLGLRYELYFPERVNGKENGALMNLADGYMHVAGVGSIPLNMGWNISYGKQFAPRIGLAYQMDPKTVFRAGYGRSFDIGVFGSIFGHVVTQNLPVLANQSVGSGSPTVSAFNLAQGPPAFDFPAVPSNGLLPAEGYSVSPKARPNPLHFPTIDAWNAAFQRAVTPTMSLTIAYVANKGTHTLGDGDSNNTNPNEAALFLPAEFSATHQTLHWDPSSPKVPDANGGVSNSDFLKRYYGGSLPACKDPNYPLFSQLAGQCAWNQGISYYGDDQNTTFNALQVTLAQQYQKGAAWTINYQWASAFSEQSGYYTWNHAVTHVRDDNVRRQQVVAYGSYDLPFGKGKAYASGVNHATDLVIGGWQLSTVFTMASGLPWSVGFDQFAPGAANPESCNDNVGGTSAPCRPNARGHMQTHLTSFDPVSKKRGFFVAQPRSGGVFSFPGLDRIGNAGANTYFGPKFVGDDMALSKTFAIWESVSTTFRMDAFNAFNHINPGNPGNSDVFVSTSVGPGTSDNSIGGLAAGCSLGQNCGPRQLEFSLHLQF
jgi:hypothetical protein